jgi:hypothetical protein
MRIKLSDADRARLGGPEWLSVRLDTLSQVEAEELDAVGVDPDNLNGYLKLRPVFGRDGEPVLDPVLDDGKPVLDESGEPKTEPRMGWPVRAWRLFVWLGLRRAGITLPYWDFDFAKTEVDSAPDEDEKPASEGKDEGPAETADSPSEASD